MKQIIQDDITYWTLERPERFNALGTTIAKELAQFLTMHHEQLMSSRALVLRAVPRQTPKGRIWIAGGDLKELAHLKNPEEYAQQMTEVCHKLETLPIPVVTVVEGAAIGGGAELALVGDLRLASQDSSLDFRQLTIGLATGYGGAKRLFDLVGKAHAQRLLFLPEPAAADIATSLGLFHQVTAPQQLEETLQKLLAHLSSLHTPSFAAQKAMLHEAAHSGDAEECRSRELHHFLGLWGNPVHRATLSKFK